MEQLATVIAFLLAVLIRPVSAPAAASCAYANTQARVQNNITVPWQQSIQVGCEKSFNVGSFHNGTGQFAGDTSLYVRGPNNFGAYFRNGDTVRVPDQGTYTLTVATNGQDGPACTETATAVVTCIPATPTPYPATPTPSSCRYGSTQARVQETVNHPWSPGITVGCDRGFNVGSFHDGTGQFATDTSLNITGPGNYDVWVSNGSRVQVPSDGVYTLAVATSGQNGAACEERATVTVACATPTPPAPPQACRYGSTQARIQRNEQQAWVSSLGVGCGDTFRVGSFHDGSGQFATDTRLEVKGPFGMNATFTNAGTIRALLPGWYILSVTTHGQSGTACQESAFVFASCENWWRR